ncbi:MAG: hypothetical protein GY865_17340 [candidate division Zixibacteria bacterium]|nr:hypothetical protein [candidate division Zixibacteria bacterium]
MEKTSKSIYCPACGKKIIERLSSGLWSFVFGKSPGRTDETPVQMLIHGNIKMKCLRRGCPQWFNLNFLPLSGRYLVEKTISPYLDMESNKQSDSSESGKTK